MRRSAALQRAAYPAVTTRIYDAPLGEVYAAARGLFDKRGWAIRHSVEPAPPAPPLPDGRRAAAAPVAGAGAVGRRGREVRPCRRMSAGPPPPSRRRETLRASKRRLKRRSSGSGTMWRCASKARPKARASTCVRRRGSASTISGRMRAASGPSWPTSTRSSGRKRRPHPGGAAAGQ